VRVLGKEICSHFSYECGVSRSIDDFWGKSEKLTRKRQKKEEKEDVSADKEREKEYKEL